MNDTVREVKKKKRRLGNEIERQIKEFERTTSTTVTYVNVERLDTSTAGEKPNSELMNVNVEAQL